MLKTRLTELVGIKYPIIQAGMGPFAVTNLCIAAANAGCLGVMSTSALASRDDKNLEQIFHSYCDAAGAKYSDDNVTIYKKMFTKVFEETKASGGIFGVNVMVSTEMLETANQVMTAIADVRNKNPEMKKRFKLLLTSAGDPMPWGKVAKENDMIWAHVMPSVKAAHRCKKAGVQIIIASGHEGGFHVSWEPVHTMVLLPAVVDAVSDANTLVVGTGGICDGKTMAAALLMGADGVQIGTRFLATKESDFAPLWKELVKECDDRGTLVARGFVGPARWLKTPASVIHADSTAKKSPGVFTGVPDDSSTVDMSLIEYEVAGLSATASGNREKAMAAAGECAQRINDIPETKLMVEAMVAETIDILRNKPKTLLA